MIHVKVVVIFAVDFNIIYVLM